VSKNQGQAPTDPAHRATARRLAHTASAEKQRPTVTGGPVEVEQRDLAVYDAAFGLTDTRTQDRAEGVEGEVA
jgi:hypothetical protein